jgi:uncharacterized protein
MKNESPPTQLDIKAFAHTGGALAGHDSLLKYERLNLEARASDSETVVNWSAKGDVRADETGAEQIWLHLQVDLCMPMVCQRCMGPVEVDLSIDQSFRFVANEAAAEAEDEEAEEDILVLSQEFNLHDLIEDEVLMALPVVPRHETCPVDVKLEVVDAGFETALAEKLNPFAALASLKSSKPS